MSNSPLERRSYAQRRELFKDIWNATMLFDDNGDKADITVKPKIIKTLRVDQSSHIKTSLRKKRLKNLRTVCNKILAFCDRQEEENLYSNQIASRGYAKINLPNTYTKLKKKKILKKAKKSLSLSKETALAKSIDSERKDRKIGTVPVDRARKRMEKAVPMVKGAVRIGAQMTSKLTSTRSPMQHANSPSPYNRQKAVTKKSDDKKKRSTVI